MADIAGPRVDAQDIARLGGQAACRANLTLALGQEMVGQKADILDPLTQGGTRRVGGLDSSLPTSAAR